MSNQSAGHPEPPLAGDEIDSLLGSWERQRATLAWKCGGLDADPMRVRLGPSAITLGGLLKHMAFVEDHTIAVKFLMQPLGPPWDTVDWGADRDWEWHSAADDSPDELFALWHAAVDRCRTQVLGLVAAGGLDQLSPRTLPDGSSFSLRRILCDLVEEYSRHVGQADLIRESIDGLVGEDPTDNPYEYFRDAPPAS